MPLRILSRSLLRQKGKPLVYKLKLHPATFTMACVILWAALCIGTVEGAKKYWRPIEGWWGFAWFVACYLLLRFLPRLLSFVAIPCCPACKHRVEPHEAESVAFRCPVCHIVIETGITHEGD